MLVEYEMKIPAADQVRLDDLNEARAAFAEAMRSAGEYAESKKAEMMKALKTGVADVEEALFREQTSLNTGMYMDRESDPAEGCAGAGGRARHAGRARGEVRPVQAVPKPPASRLTRFRALDLAAKGYRPETRLVGRAVPLPFGLAELDVQRVRDAGAGRHHQRRGRRIHRRVQDAQAAPGRPGGDAHRKWAFTPSSSCSTKWRTEALQPRHWEKIFAVFEKGAYDPEKPPTASDLLEWGALDRLEQLENIGATASKEYSLAQTLKKMTKEWEGQEFQVHPVQRLGDVRAGRVGRRAGAAGRPDRQGAGHRDPFVKPFEADAKGVVRDSEHPAGHAGQLAEVPADVAVPGAHLLVGGHREADARGGREVPPGGQRVARHHERHQGGARRHRNRQGQRAAGPTGGVQHLVGRDPEGALRVPGEEALIFPRFFFLSNDEMLEILSETKDPTRVQPHLKKCFEGVAKLKFEGEDFLITAMISEEQEEVPLMNPIPVADANGAVEKWLLQVEAKMFDSIHNVTGEGLKAYTAKPRDQWVLDWPGMVVLVCTAVNWTADVTRAIDEGKGAVKAYEEKCTADLLKIVDRVRGELTSLQRKTLGALVVMDVHARDVVSVLAKNGVASASDFDWQAQLRSYWEEDPTRGKRLDGDHAHHERRGWVTGTSIWELVAAGDHAANGPVLPHVDGRDPPDDGGPPRAPRGRARRKPRRI